MYFILRCIAILIFQITSLSTSLILVAIVYVGYGTMIALVRPYKETYMNIIDTLIIENLALLALIADKYNFEDSENLLTLCYVVILSIFVFLPLLCLMGFIAYRILKKIKSGPYPFGRKKHNINSSESTAVIPQQDLLEDDIDNSDQALPDRIQNPQLYTVDMYRFENVNYMKAS